MSNSNRNDAGLQSLSDILARLFTDAAPCQMCGRRIPTYHDREKGSHYCLPCLETAVKEAEAEWEAEWEAGWLAMPMEDGPEDPEIVAMGQAILDELFPLSASHAETVADELRSERQDMALIACHSRQLAA